MKIESAKDLRVYQKAYALAMSSGYLTTERHKKLAGECSIIGSMLGKMIGNPGPFLIQAGPMECDLLRVPCREMKFVLQGGTNYSTGEHIPSGKSKAIYLISDFRSPTVIVAVLLIDTSLYVMYN